MPAVAELQLEANVNCLPSDEAGTPTTPVPRPTLTEAKLPNQLAAVRNNTFLLKHVNVRVACGTRIDTQNRQH